MKLFERKKAKQHTIIVGCGRLGANLANELSNQGENVTILDGNKASFRRLAPNFGGLSIVADGSDLHRLCEAGIESASAVIAVTNHDNTNIMVAQIARDLFGVERVIARLYDPECETVYRRLGIHTICPSVLSAKEIDKLLCDCSAKGETA